MTLPTLAPSVVRCLDCDGATPVTTTGVCGLCGSASVMAMPPLMFRRDKVSRPEFYRPQVRPRPRGLA